MDGTWINKAWFKKNAISNRHVQIKIAAIVSENKLSKGGPSCLGYEKLKGNIPMALK